VALAERLDYRRRRIIMLRNRVLAAIAGVTLLGAAAAAVVTAPHAAAAPGAGSIVRAAGQISALQSNGFTLHNAAHTYTVSVGPDTWIVVKQAGKPAQGALSDLAVGETVWVAGTQSGTDQVAARVVTAGAVKGAIRKGVGRAAAKPPAPLAAKAQRQGTVQANTNGTLTLREGKAGKKNLAVATDAETIVIRGGIATPGDIKVGDEVRVIWRSAAAGAKATPGAARRTPAAAVVYVTSPSDRFALGVVKSVAGANLTVKGVGGDGKVTIAANATIKTLGAAGQAPTAAGLSDIKAGARVLLYGPKPTAGQPATATVVVILPGTAK
jgi:sarcosine oxidase gamma subunit